MISFNKQIKQIPDKKRNTVINVTAVTLSPIWDGETVVCIGGGHSLTKEQVSLVKKYKTIGVNNAYQIAPFIDILYACDYKWWDWHKGCPDFAGYKLQHYPERRLEEMSLSLPYPDINTILSSGCSGFDERLDRIRHGGNSGYQALHVAMHLGASRIILLGYDMYVKDKTHWFGEHPNQNIRSNTEKYKRWIDEFPILKEEANKRGQYIVNCTPNSSLKCFDMKNLKGILK